MNNEQWFIVANVSISKNHHTEIIFKKGINMKPCPVKATRIEGKQLYTAYITAPASRKKSMKKWKQIQT